MYITFKLYVDILFLLSNIMQLKNFSHRTIVPVNLFIIACGKSFYGRA